MTRRVLAAFAVSVLGSVGFTAAYVLDGGPQLQGLTLAAAAGGLGVGLALWSRGLMPPGPFVEEREDVSPPTEQEERAAAALKVGAREVGRRRLLGRALVLTAGALGLTALWPLRSLGTQGRGGVAGPQSVSPVRALRETPWAPGVRLVDDAGRLVPVDELQVGGLLTVFPEGHAGSADAQTVLLRVGIERICAPALRGRTGPRSGHLAYSKLCTHAGCPVGLYQQQAHTLVCPCHQASFDVLDEARPVFGPAARPLPQLPLAVDDDGHLVARGGFTAPPGPTFWSLDT